MKRLGTAVTALLLLLALLLAGSAQADTVVYVKGGWLRMREAPSFDAKTIASYYTNSAMTYLGATGAWYYVRATDGMTGYMYSAYLTTTAPSVQPQPRPQPGGTTAYVWAANGRGVRLRQGPGTNYGVIGLYNVGTSVKILSRGTYWHYIQVGKQTGYMMAQYLADTQPVNPQPQPQPQPQPTVNYTAYVYAANGKPVNLREGAGKNYRATARFPVGTQVTVLSHGATWDYIQVGAQTGYMMNRYLKTSYTPAAPTVNTVITGVTLSNAAPGPGQTVSAVVTPAGASCTCKWYNDQGTLLSSSAAYTVQYTDVGRRILVAVTGTGGSTGYATSPYSNVITQTATSGGALTGVSIDSLSPGPGVAIHASVQPALATANYAWYRDDGALVGNGAVYVPQAADAGHRLYCIATGAGSYSGTVVSSFTNPVSGGASTAALSGTVALPATISPGTLLNPTVLLNTGHLNYTWYANNVVVGTGATLYVDSSLGGTSLRLVVTAAPGSGYEGTVSSGYCLVLNNAGGIGSYPIATTTGLYP